MAPTKAILKVFAGSLVGTATGAVVGAAAGAVVGAAAGAVVGAATGAVVGAAVGVAAGVHAENSIEAITSDNKTFHIAFLVNISLLLLYLTR